MSTDHLAGRSGYTHELLAELTDSQLREQLHHYRAKRERLLAMPDSGEGNPFRSSAYSAYRTLVHIGMVHRELGVRGLSVA